MEVETQGKRRKEHFKEETASPSKTTTLHRRKWVCSPDLLCGEEAGFGRALAPGPPLVLPSSWTFRAWSTPLPPTRAAYREPARGAATSVPGHRPLLLSSEAGRAVSILCTLPGSKKDVPGAQEAARRRH